MYMCMHMCIYVNIHVHTYEYACIYILCLFLRVCMSFRVCVCVCMFVRVIVYLCVRFPKLVQVLTFFELFLSLILVSHWASCGFFYIAYGWYLLANKL